MTDLNFFYFIGSHSTSDVQMSVNLNHMNVAEITSTDQSAHSLNEQQEDA